MKSEEVREIASKAASERREENKEMEMTHHADIPKDIEFATLDDLDDIKADNFTVVPIRGKSGKIYNWLVRRLKAGERSSLNQSMFPKSVLAKIQNQQLGGKKGKPMTVADTGMSIEEVNEAMFNRDCLTIKKATVFPKGITTEHIRDLETSDFDRLLEAANIDVNANDDAARFLEDGGLDTGQPETDAEVEELDNTEE